MLAYLHSVTFHPTGFDTSNLACGQVQVLVLAVIYSLFSLLPIFPHTFRSEKPILPFFPQNHGEITFNGNVLDGESQNDGPNHSQSHFAVTVDNLCKTEDGDR